MIVENKARTGNMEVLGKGGSSTLCAKSGHANAENFFHSSLYSLAQITTTVRSC